MTNIETAARIRKWLTTPGLSFSWPTDGCGYEQHVRFVKHRNKNWKGVGTFKQFVLDYADTLEHSE